MAATIKDVAKKAGVSHTTVSMVIHNDKRITADTRDKVMKAIKDLNYHPNIMARGLVRGRSNTIAIVASFFSSVFEVSFLRGVESASAGLEYSINQYSTRIRGNAKEEILSSIVYGHLADAVISLGIMPDEELMQEYRESGIPFVMVEENLPGAHLLTVDNYKAGFMATDYLASKGKKDIGIIVGKVGAKELGFSPGERLRGYREALKKNGLKFDQEKVYEITDFFFDDGAKALSYFTDRGIRVDSVFSAAGDMVAMGLIKEARRRRIKLPEQLAVVGFDDIEVSSLVNPSLTTIRQPVAEMGRKAIELAVSSIEGKLAGPQKIVFEPELIVRESA